MTGLIGIDVGGTFTDFLAIDEETGKVSAEKILTTYPDPSVAVKECIERSLVPIPEVRHLRHGTTLGINTIIEGKGLPTALLTTAGFADVLALRRGSRSESFNLSWAPATPLIPGRLRLEVDERTHSDGTVARSVDEARLLEIGEALVGEGIRAVGICFINSYVNPENERRAAELLHSRWPDLYISVSSDLGRELGEYERSSTVAINAILQPVLHDYLGELADYLEGRDFRGRAAIMQSTGGITSFDRARRQPSLVIESGPAAGVVAASQIAVAAQMPNVIALDVGGTTAKAAALIAGNTELTGTYEIGGARGYALQVPGIDIVEVGAGGGSIAHVGAGGALRVGPRSAGASPGPACYGNGGTEPTITDANVVLGRLNPERFAMGAMKLDVEAAREAVAGVAAELGTEVPALAAGIIEIGNTIMAGAVRAVTIERGIDPRDFVLVAYGGAAPIQACDIARQLHIATVLIPPYPGHFSSVGLLLTRSRRDYVRSISLSTDAPDFGERLQSAFAEMRATAVAEFAADAEAGDGGAADPDTYDYEYSADMRYRGQWHTVTVRLPSIASREDVTSAFAENFVRRFGHRSSGGLPEVLVLRLGVVAHDGGDGNVGFLSYPMADVTEARTRRVYSDMAAEYVDCPVYDRSALRPGAEIPGPALVEEEASTTYIGEADRLVVNDLGCLVITVGSTS